MSIISAKRDPFSKHNTVTFDEVIGFEIEYDKCNDKVKVRKNERNIIKNLFFKNNCTL